MGAVRASLRMVALVATTTPIYLGVLFCKPVAWFSTRRSLAIQDFWVRTWARACARILGMRITVDGASPAPPFFLVSNHLSYVDIVVLFSVLDCHFIAKSDVARWPVMGFLARTAGTLFIRRESKRDLTRVIPAVQALLGAGRGVVVFPEGTSTKGDAVARFKPSLFEVAILTETPVSYAALSYVTPDATPPAHLSVCWWGDMEFMPHLFRLLALPRFDATVAFGGARITADDRKVLAARAQRAVEDQFTPVVGYEA